MGPAHPCHTGRRPFMHSARPYGPAGLLSPWTVRPLDVRNTLGAALSSARTALTRMFFDACTTHQVSCARREARRPLPRPPSSASSPVVLHGGIELFVMVSSELLIHLSATAPLHRFTAARQRETCARQLSHTGGTAARQRETARDSARQPRDSRESYVNPCKTPVADRCTSTSSLYS